IGTWLDGRRHRLRRRRHGRLNRVGIVRLRSIECRDPETDDEQYRCRDEDWLPRNARRWIDRRLWRRRGRSRWQGIRERRLELSGALIPIGGLIGERALDHTNEGVRQVGTNIAERSRLASRRVIALHVGARL